MEVFENGVESIWAAYVTIGPTAKGPMLALLQGKLVSFKDSTPSRMMVGI